MSMSIAPLDTSVMNILGPAALGDTTALCKLAKGLHSYFILEPHYSQNPVLAEHVAHSLKRNEEAVLRLKDATSKADLAELSLHQDILTAIVKCSLNLRDHLIHQNTAIPVPDVTHLILDNTAIPVPDSSVCVFNAYSSS